MKKDVADSSITLDELQLGGDYADDVPQADDVIKYCRRCEFACPVGKDSAVSP
jgi:hypothetical protein